MVRQHQSNYQKRDYDCIEYNLVDLPNTSFSIRGPLPDLQKPYFVSIGAAQSFGCFTERPYPSQISDQIGIPCLNLGFGGVGPEFFLRNTELISYINNSLFCIVQVMSARSVSNSRCISLGSEYGYDRRDGVRKSTHKIFDDYLKDSGAPSIHALNKRIKSAARRFLPFPRAESAGFDLAEETRERWVNDYLMLSYAITTPTILFWFSTRKPAYCSSNANADSLFGSFPQLVNQKMIGVISPYFGPYVECITKEGLPQPLLSRFTGLPIICRGKDDREELSGNDFSENRYYPSPQMHDNASNMLTSAIHAWTSYLGVESLINSPK